MSRPDGHIGPGDSLTLELAPPFGAVTVDPITGGQELWLAGRRLGGLSAAAQETLVLSAGMVRGGGGDPDAWLVGDRSRLLLAVLCAGYGAPDEVWVRCPECGEMHEMPFDPRWVLDRVPAGTEGKGMRLPTGGDLIVLEGGGATALLERCAPGWDAAAFEDEIAMNDPAAEVLFGLTCVTCGAAFSARFDPLSLLMAEIGRGGGVLAEIDQLARAYRWSEADLLAMPAWRRRLYLRHIAEAADAPNYRVPS